VAEYASPLVNTRQLAWVIASLLGWYGSGNATARYIMELNGPGMGGAQCHQGTGGRSSTTPTSVPPRRERVAGYF